MINPAPDNEAKMELYGAAHDLGAEGGFRIAVMYPPRDGMHDLPSTSYPLEYVGGPFLCESSNLPGPKWTKREFRQFFRGELTTNFARKSVPLNVWSFHLILGPEVKRGHSLAFGLIPNEHG